MNNPLPDEVTETIEPALARIAGSLTLTIVFACVFAGLSEATIVVAELTYPVFLGVYAGAAIPMFAVFYLFLLNPIDQTSVSSTVQFTATMGILAVGGYISLYLSVFSPSIATIYIFTGAVGIVSAIGYAIHYLRTPNYVTVPKTKNE